MGRLVHFRQRRYANETIEGAGLACGVFEYLLSLNRECPKVIGATHFHGMLSTVLHSGAHTDMTKEIFESGFLKPRPSLSFGHM